MLRSSYSRLGVVHALAGLLLAATACAPQASAPATVTTPAQPTAAPAAPTAAPQPAATSAPKPTAPPQG